VRKIEIRRKLKALNRLRQPDRSEWFFLLGVAMVLALVVPFFAYDWAQRTATASANAKAYQGDAVIIAIDQRSESGLPSQLWSERDLATLVEKVGGGDPARVIIDRQYFKFARRDGSDRLAGALASLKRPAVWVIEISSDDAAAIRSTKSPGPDAQFAQTSSQIPSAFARLVQPAVMTFQVYPLGAPIFTPTAVKTDAGRYRSLPVILAGRQTDADAEIIDIDVSLKPQSIPVYSAGDVLSGMIGPETFTQKYVVISHTGQLDRDTVTTPNDDYTSRAALAIMAAETIKSGPAIDIGWWPAFVLSVLAAILWLVLPRPYGRFVAAGAFVLIAISPLVLERILIFQQTSQGVALLLIVAASKTWRQGRMLVQEYRTASETKSQFLAQASHDLRQPIHAIGLLADRLGETDLSPEQSELVSKLSWSVDNASRMFRVLLDIAAIESGALKAEIGPVSIADLFAELDSQNALAAEMQGVDLRLVPCTAIVQSDRALLATMVQNLVSNAIRYSPGKKVLVGCRRQGGSATLVVIDDGRGISPSDLEHVQKAFFRSSRGSDLRSDNKGLGLAIVNRLATMLGLKFALSSEQGRGTRASIENLRLIEARAEVPMTPANLRLPLANVRVFVIEDDAETLASTQNLLERWGCVVETSSSVPNSLPKCEILLSDFDFGTGDTLASKMDLLRQLKSSETSLVVISGHHPDQVHDSLPGIEAVVLSKPLRAAELRSALMAVRMG
jgi:signal transduction histidine kinase/CheY-like chemotaxis protein